MTSKYCYLEHINGYCAVRAGVRALVAVKAFNLTGAAYVSGSLPYTLSLDVFTEIPQPVLGLSYAS